MYATTLIDTNLCKSCRSRLCPAKHGNNLQSLSRLPACSHVRLDVESRSLPKSTQTSNACVKLSAHPNLLKFHAMPTNTNPTVGQHSAALMPSYMISKSPSRDMRFGHISPQALFDNLGMPACAGQVIQEMEASISKAIQIRSWSSNAKITTARYAMKQISIAKSHPRPVPMVMLHSSRTGDFVNPPLVLLNQSSMGNDTRYLTTHESSSLRHFNKPFINSFRSTGLAT